MSDCCIVDEMGERERQIAARIAEIVCLLKTQFPEVAVSVDVWRFATLVTGEFKDEDRFGWVRVAESVEALYIEKDHKLWEQGVGKLILHTRQMIVPSSYKIEVGDVVLLSGTSWEVVEAPSLAGISRLKLNEPKSKFQNPARGTATFRQIAARARIS
jgi:hypothetical protein